MREQHAFIGDSNDVIVEGARGNRFFGLLSKDNALVIEPVQACNGF